VSGALEEKLAAIAAAKFDGIEIFDNDLVASPQKPLEVAQRCADLGLSIDLFQPVQDVEGVPPKQFSNVLHRVARKLDVMEQLGVTTLLACSNTAREAVGDRDLSAEQAPSSTMSRYFQRRTPRRVRRAACRGLGCRSRSWLPVDGPRPGDVGERTFPKMI